MFTEELKIAGNIRYTEEARKDVLAVPHVRCACHLVRYDNANEMVQAHKHA